MSDKTKFIAFIDLHKQKSEKLRVNNERGKARIGEYGEYCDLSHVGETDVQTSNCKVSAPSWRE